MYTSFLKVVAFHVIFQIELNVLIPDLMLRCYFINTAFWDCNGYLHEHSVNSRFHAATNGSHWRINCSSQYFDNILLSHIALTSPNLQIPSKDACYKNSHLSPWIVYNVECIPTA